MFSRISKTWDRKAHRTRKNVLWKIDEKVEDVNLDDLWEHISELWKLREKGDHEKACRLRPYTWPNVPGLRDLKGSVLLGGDHYQNVKAILTSVNVAIVAPLVVAQTLERLDIDITNREELWDLTKIMYDLAILLKKLSERPEGMQGVMEEATSLIVKGACVLSHQGGPLRSDADAIQRELDTMYVYIITEFTARVFTPITHRRRSHLSEKYPTHAVEVKDVNLDDLWEHISELWKPREEVDNNLSYPWEHISELWKPREEENHKKGRSLVPFTWPHVPGLHKLKEFVSIGTDLPIEEVYGTVQAILEEIGRENAATAAPLVVAHTLDRLDDSYTYGVEFCRLVEEMYELAIVLKRFSEIPEETQAVMQEATALIVEGARVFSRRRRYASDVPAFAIRDKLNTMKWYINTEFTVRVLPRIKHQLRSHHSKEYPTHAGLILYEENLLSTRRQKVFKMKALKVATNNFHKDNKVGQGGFGAVYKGTTRDGEQIAVKKMSFKDERSREFMKRQFESEKLLAEFQHPNLVNLLGSCEQKSQGFLVYEYLPNGSLDKFLFDADKRKELDWKKQYNIILGLARGLLHLQQDSIVHRDFKTSNILLDDELKPKIADFGTAKVLPEDRTHVTVTTKSRVVTYGYLPLEYIYTGKISERTDVYGFGIVLLEILFGKKISSEAFFERVWRSYKKKKFVPTIDPTMTETEKAKALRCIQVGLLCIQEDLLRPTMSQVITMLSTSENLPLPKKPPLVSSTDEVENDNSTMEN